MRLKSALLVGTIMLTPTLASAQAISGLYVGAGAGANFMLDQSLKSVDIGGAAASLGKSKIRYNVGARGLASVGYGFGNGLRVEIEGDYMLNGYDKIGTLSGGGLGANFNRAAGVNIKGQEQKYGGFVNALYDFDPRTLGMGSFPLAMTPYVGVGAGYLQILQHDTNISSDNTYLLRTRGTSGTFAYQAIIGTAIPISAVPGLSATVEYRFTGMTDNHAFKGQFFDGATITSAKLHDAGDYNNSIMVGLRYAFNSAPPPPPPAPAPVPAPIAAPSRTYLVFFDWDRADLTERARQIIGDAAANSKRVQYTRIQVNGYTDLSGTAAYNQRLSVRRAEAVAGELVRDGVPRTAINIQGFGESDPLVPTAQGVREPQNRRVQIVIQ